MFKPVLALMNRARYLQKFCLIFLVFMAPFGWLAFDKLTTLASELQGARRELLGLQAFEAALPACKAALDLAALHLLGHARNKPDSVAAIELGRRYLEQTGQTFDNWLGHTSFAVRGFMLKDPSASLGVPQANQVLSALYVDETRAALAQLATLKEIGADSRLTMDGDPRLYRATDLLISEILPLYATLTQTRGYAAYISAYGFLESTSRATVVSQPGLLEPYVQAGNGADNPSARRLMAEAAQEAQALYTSSIVEPYSQSGAYDEASIEHWQERFDHYQPSIEKLDAAFRVVVADEVRHLAIRSQALTGDIQHTIEGLQQQVGNAVRTIQSSHASASTRVGEVTLTADIFQAITQAMEEIIDHNLQIASAAEQQAQVVEGVERNTLEIRALSESNASEARTTVQVSDEVAGMTRELHRLIAHFKV